MPQVRQRFLPSRGQREPQHPGGSTDTPARRPPPPFPVFSLVRAGPAAEILSQHCGVTLGASLWKAAGNAVTSPLSEAEASEDARRAGSAAHRTGLLVSPPTTSSQPLFLLFSLF